MLWGQELQPGAYGRALFQTRGGDLGEKSLTPDVGH